VKHFIVLVTVLTGIAIVGFSLFANTGSERVTPNP
jgi:hypothetical protein